MLAAGLANLRTGFNFFEDPTICSSLYFDFFT
jgi:hypothetical protein